MSTPQRPHRLTLVFTKDERQILREIAARNAVSCSAFLRKLVEPILKKELDNKLSNAKKEKKNED